MKPLVMAELISSLAMGCIFLGMYVRKDISKPAFRLKVVELCTIIWALADAGAVLLNGPKYPIFLQASLSLIAYAMDGLCLIAYVFYCKSVVEEKIHVRGILFWISTVIVSIAFVWTIIDFFNHKMVIFENGYTVWVNSYSYIPTYMELFILLTIPVYAAVRHKSIGIKNVSMLGLYGILPIFTTIVYIFRGGDNYSPVAALFALMIVAEILQNDMVLEKEREHTRAINEAREAAEEANAAKTVFLNNMSHDMRTPMNAILGFTELMEKEVNNPEVLTNYIAKLHHSGEYLLTIINSVLDMARIESGKTVLDIAPYDMHDENTSATTILTELFKQKRMHFRKTVRVKHPYVLLDVTRVQQITVNLISNAIKYTPEGGYVSMYLYEIPCDREGYGRYVAEISDNGIGMSEEFQEHIFDNFSRERNTTESKIVGTGLGMSIVKKLVDLMGGTIEVESKLGEGTKFTVVLDHKIIDHPDDYIKKQRKERTENVSIEGTRVLLAEDNDLNAEIAMAVFEEHGLVIERAEDGVQCVDMLSKSEPGYYDLILMDIQMPNLNGYDATRKIRALEDEKAKIPIIAMTANAFDEDRKMALDSGMNEHLTKPLRIEEALKTISKVLLQNS